MYLKIEKTIVTVGSFDGVHRGHRVLLRRVVELAQQNSLKSVAITFHPHPRQTLDSSGDAPLLLNTFDERISLLKQTGVDKVVVLPFDKALAQMSAHDFVKKIIIEKFNAQYIVVGQDHHFGKERGGDVQRLLDFSVQNDLRVEIVDLKNIEQKISSSAIREALMNGNLTLANDMLGYRYVISGKVIGGNQLGRTIGFPTANVEPPECKLIPKGGVYRVKVKTGSDELERLGMMYIGKRSILKNDGESVNIEANIFDFDQQVYGQEIALTLTHRIRDDKKFDNIEQLSEQLHRDKQKIMTI